MLLNSSAPLKRSPTPAGLPTPTTSARSFVDSNISARNDTEMQFKGEGRRNNTRTSDAKLVKGEEVLIPGKTAATPSERSGRLRCPSLGRHLCFLIRLEDDGRGSGPTPNPLIGWPYFVCRNRRALFKDPAIAKAQLAVTNV